MDTEKQEMNATQIRYKRNSDSRFKLPRNNVIVQYLVFLGKYYNSKNEPKK